MRLECLFVWPIDSVCVFGLWPLPLFATLIHTTVSHRGPPVDHSRAHNHTHSPFTSASLESRLLDSWVPKLTLPDRQTQCSTLCHQPKWQLGLNHCVLCWPLRFPTLHEPSSPRSVPTYIQYLDPYCRSIFHCVPTHWQHLSRDDNQLYMVLAELLRKEKSWEKTEASTMVSVYYSSHWYKSNWI